MNLVDVEAVLLQETDDAFLLDDQEGSREWVPRSLVEENDDGTFTMPEWLADEKGFTVTTKPRRAGDR